MFLRHRRSNPLVTQGTTSTWPRLPAPLRRDASGDLDTEGRGQRTGEPVAVILAELLHLTGELRQLLTRQLPEVHAHCLKKCLLFHFLVSLISRPQASPHPLQGTVMVLARNSYCKFYCKLLKRSFVQEIPLGNSHLSFKWNFKK